MRKSRTSRHDKMTIVHIAAGLLRAHVIKAKLEEAGIPALLDYESIGPIYGITADGLGEVQILVPDDCAEEAQKLIEESPIPGTSALESNVD